MKSGSHKKSFSCRDLLSCNSLRTFKIDPFSTPRLNKKIPVILRPICHKRLNSDNIKSSPFTQVSVAAPETNKNRSGQNLFNNSQVNKNPCFIIPKLHLKLPEFKTPSLSKVSKLEEPFKTTRAHQTSLNHLNKQMTHKMNRLIKRREEKISDSSLDFSFGAKNNSALNN